MEFLNKNKITLSAVVIFALALWLYSAFFKNDAPVAVSNGGAETVGADVLSLNAALQAVNLDQSLFSSALYRNLSDFSTPVPNQPVGRPNPFDTIGRD